MNKILFFLLFFTLISCFKEDEPSVDQVFLDWNSTYLGVDSITNFYPLELKTALQEVKIVVDSALRDYKIFTPRDYDPSKKYPLLFFIFHVVHVRKFHARVLHHAVEPGIKKDGKI